MSGPFLGRRAEDDRDVEFEERLNRSETRGNAVRSLLADAADHDGDAVLALKRAREPAPRFERTPQSDRGGLRRRRHATANDAETQTSVLSHAIWNSSCTCGRCSRGRHRSRRTRDIWRRWRSRGRGRGGGFGRRVSLVFAVPRCPSVPYRPGLRGAVSQVASQPLDALSHFFACPSYGR